MSSARAMRQVDNSRPEGFGWQRMDTLFRAPSRPGSRLLGLDQARAVAIIAMMVFHFAPGVFIQLPRFEPFRDPVLWFGRMATPAFVVVFGVTAGFVFLSRYVRGKPGN